MLNRLKLEGANTKADVVLGLDTNLMAEAAEDRPLRHARHRRGEGTNARSVDG
jgi:ABC-type thiamine transport system substrate-binding protein